MREGDFAEWFKVAVWLVFTSPCGLGAGIGLRSQAEHATARVGVERHALPLRRTTRGEVVRFVPDDEVWRNKGRHSSRQ